MTVDQIPRPALFVQPTPRQVEVARAIAEGLTDQEIADRLGVGLNTVRTHVESLRERLGARSRAHAVGIAYEVGILTPGLTGVSSAQQGDT